MAVIGQIPGNGRPFGDIYTAATPYIDKLSNQLYTEQKQRELLREKQNEALDAEFSKNVGAIRDADIPQFIKNYQNWKQLRKGLISTNQSNQSDYIQKQLTTQKALADMYQTLNKSKQAKQEEEATAKDLIKNPDAYSDDAHKLLAMRRNLPVGSMVIIDPTGQGNNIDLSNIDNLKYKGTNTDFGKLITAAQGQPKTVYSEEKPVDKEGRQTDITPYSFGNTPAQVKDALVGNFALHKAGRDAEHLWSNIPQAELQQTIHDYLNIPEEKWKKMGMSGPDKLEINNADSKAEKYATYLAMKYAINNEPKAGTVIRKNNQAAIDERNFQQQKEIEGLKFGHEKGLIDYRKDVKGSGTGTEQDAKTILDQKIDKMFNEGATSKQAMYVKGVAVPGRLIGVPSEFYKRYAIKNENGHDVAPLKFIMSEDKQYVVPVYPGQSSKERTDHIPIDVFRDELGKVLRTKNQLLKEDSSGGSKTYEYQGHKYTEEEIQRAATNLKMSVPDYLKKYGIK